MLADPIAFSTITELIVVHFGRADVDKVVGIEARGFIIASPVAYHLRTGRADPQAGQAPLDDRRRGLRARVRHRHPRAARRRHRSRRAGADRFDDVLATGGTAQAAASLVQQVGGNVCGIATVIELDFLHGRERLAEHELYTLIHY